MKSTIILIFLAVNGLLIDTTKPASATTDNSSTHNLSQKISELVKIDIDKHQLVDAAIARVLAAKQQKIEIQHARHHETATNNSHLTENVNSRNSHNNLITKNIPLMGDIQIMIEPRNSVRNALGNHR
jgi:hypothetical protein